MFISSSLSIALEFWSVKYTSIYEISKLNAFKNKFFDEITNNWPYNVLGTNETNV